MAEIPGFEPFTTLCFGDSNTWGRMPGIRRRRYGIETRWTGVLRRQLGAGYHVVADGIEGRTTHTDDHIGGDLNGSLHLESRLMAHHPLDLVILSMGGCDLKARLGLSVTTVSEGIRHLGTRVLESEAWPGAGSPQLVILSPLILHDGQLMPDEYAGAVAKSRDLVDRLDGMASELGCHYVDINGIVPSEQLIGIHLNAQAHELVGGHLAAVVRSMCDTA